MNLFKKQALVNESNAVKALETSAKTIIAKYIITSEWLNSSLMSDKEGCLMCKIDKATKLMARLHQQVGEVAKTYELITSRPLDLDKITKKAVKKHYPLLYAASEDSPSSTSSTSSNGVGKPSEDAIRKAIVKAISKVTGTPVGEVGIEGGLMNRRAFDGLNPNDFDSFPDFLAAVKAKSEKMDKLSTKKGEDILTDVAIETAETKAKATVKTSSSSKGESSKTTKTDA